MDLTGQHVGWLTVLRAESVRTAYNKGFADAMKDDIYSEEPSFNPPYKIDDDRHADYSFGFQMGVKEYDS